MAKDRISELYERGRIFPDGRNSEDHTRPTSTPKRGTDGLGKHVEVHRPQHLENQRDTGDRYPGDASGRYHNEHQRDWVRGHDGKSRVEDGRKQTFDFDGHSYKRKDGGNDWRSGSDFRPIKKKD